MFLTRISGGYREFNVSYHNDLHAFDVFQMAFVLLSGTSGVASRAKLSSLDCLAALVGAACHDFKHDGFNNIWHKTNNTDRFKEHGAEGTQEKFHFAESWKVLMRDDCNFIGQLSFD
jgi:hypothetical protein